MTKITKRMRTTRTTLDNMIAKIKTDVQAFAENMAAVTRDTARLAPLVAQAFERYKDEVGADNATKLGFIKLFATPEQLATWPETDRAAKTPGAATQALFNSIEYLLRRAGQIAKAQELQAQRERIHAEATVLGRKEAKARGLKTEEEVDALIAEKEHNLLQAAGLMVERATQEDVVEIILNGWMTDLDEYDNFAAFVAQLLMLKYAENTVTTIMQKAQKLIAETQESAAESPPQVEEKTVVAPAPRTVQFRKHIAVA